MKVPANVAGIAKYLTVNNKTKGTEKKTTVPSEDILKQSQGLRKDMIIVKEVVERKKTPVRKSKPVKTRTPLSGNKLDLMKVKKSGTTFKKQKTVNFTPTKNNIFNYFEKKGAGNNPPEGDLGSSPALKFRNEAKKTNSVEEIQGTTGHAKPPCGRQGGSLKM